MKIDGASPPTRTCDGQSYRQDWPGTNPNPVVDRALHPTPLLFTSPTTNGRNFSTMAFETDLPAIEVQGAQANPPFCNTSTGANCVNPPNGARFYPIFSTTFRHGSCTWQEGGRFLPGTINNFGGTSTAEFGPLLKVLFPEAGFTTSTRFDDFNSGNLANPCPVRYSGYKEAVPEHPVTRYALPGGPRPPGSTCVRARSGRCSGACQGPAGPDRPPPR